MGDPQTLEEFVELGMTNYPAANWQNVPEYRTLNSNNFQVEMFFDSAIQLTWLAIAATDGVDFVDLGMLADDRLDNCPYDWPLR